MSVHVQPCYTHTIQSLQPSTLLGSTCRTPLPFAMQYAAFLTFFLFGTATALDTLGSQAYGAAKKGVRGGLCRWVLQTCTTLFAPLPLMR